MYEIVGKHEKNYVCRKLDNLHFILFNQDRQIDLTVYFLSFTGEEFD
jgi:hypothetical protein